MNENDKQIEFILLPDKGNMVTEKDISKRNSIRITAKFKHIFPDETTTFIVNANTITDECKFEHRDGKSHYIHLSKALFDELNLRAGDSLLIKKNADNLDFTTIRTLTLSPISEYNIDYKKERVTVIFTNDKGIYLGYKNFDGKWYDLYSNSYDTASHFAELPPDPISQRDGAIPHVYDSWNRIDAKKDNTSKIFADKFPFVLLFDCGEITATSSESYWFDSKGNTFPEVKHWIGVKVAQTP